MPPHWGRMNASEEDGVPVSNQFKPQLQTINKITIAIEDI